MRVYNFNPGPATLPLEVLENTAQAVLELDGCGKSILEVNHRGPEYLPIHRQTQADLLELLRLSAEEYSVLFLGGGARTQFAMVPMNYLPADGIADYVDTGIWSSQAIVEARRFGEVNVAGSSKGQDFSSIPKALRFSANPRYIHLTSNNTVYGTQIHEFPQQPGVPLICDMSSDFLSRVLDFSRFDLIYAGAQKNIGPAGVTVVVIRRSFAEKANRDLPRMFSYPVHVEAESLANTPPVFGVYVVGQVAKWLVRQGGIGAVERINREKATTLYQALEGNSDFYRLNVPEPEDRSYMNVTFRLPNEALEHSFVVQAQDAGFHGLKGHRFVGGCRASIYNAFPLEGVRAFVEFIEAFAAKNR